MGNKSTNCVECMSAITGKSSSACRVYCSIYCRRKFKNKKSVKLNGEKFGIISGSVGAINELIVCVDLLKKGYQIYKSVSPASPCDFVVSKDKVLILLEVTGAYYWAEGKYSHPKKKKNKENYQCLALVFRSGEIIYEPKIETFFKIKEA